MPLENRDGAPSENPAGSLVETESRLLWREQSVLLVYSSRFLLAELEDDVLESGAFDARV